MDELEPLTEPYESIRYELLNRLVQICGEVAVLTFNHASYQRIFFFAGKKSLRGSNLPFPA